MAKKKTHEEFVKEVYELVGDEYEFLSIYTYNYVKIKLRHKKCCYVWETKPNNLISSIKRTKHVMCPFCSNTIKLSTEFFVERVRDLVGNEYEVLGEYVNTSTKIKMQHNVCGNSYEVTPHHFLQGKRCPKCQFKKVGKLNSKLHDDFVKEVFNIVGEEYVILSEYINNRKKVMVLHEKCNNSYEVSPNRFLSGCRCPFCNSPKGELKIKDWLDKNNVKNKTQFTFEDCKYIGLLKFDFALMDKQNNLICLIEYDGEQHFRSVDFFGGKNGFIKRKKCDQIKNIYCKENNVPLYRIPYWKFNEIESILNKLLIQNKHVEIDENFIII